MCYLVEFAYKIEMLLQATMSLLRPNWIMWSESQVCTFRKLTILQTCKNNVKFIFIPLRKYWRRFRICNVVLVTSATTVPFNTFSQCVSLSIFAKHAIFLSSMFQIWIHVTTVKLDLVTYPISACVLFWNERDRSALKWFYGRWTSTIRQH